MQTEIVDLRFNLKADRKDLILITAFGFFSYVLLSLWGYLVARDLGVVVSPRRLVVCTVGAGIFWLALSRLKRQNRVDLGALLASIVIAGLTILMVRLGLVQLSASPIEPEHSVRWSLAWSGYFGIWLLAAVPPSPPVSFRAGRPDVEIRANDMDTLPGAYLDQLLALPGDDRADTR
jgi:hypothetical protein